MKKTGRNDPCPCGSGKKYKHCCLQAEPTQALSDRSEAVPRAIDWLMTRHGPAVREALGEGFFGTLDEDEYARLQEQHADSFEGILINAMEWLLAEGSIRLKRQEYPVAELLLGHGGPLFTAAQRQWITLLAERPLRLYEVLEVWPRESMRLKDLAFPQDPPVLVREKSGSQQAAPFDVIAARVIPVEEHFELSGAVYSIPRHRSLDLMADLRRELEGVDSDSHDAREIPSVVIRDYWLRLFIEPFEMPTLIDHSTGDPLLFVTDHYRVRDWETLEQALSGEADIDGNRQEGWSRLFEGEDGLIRSRLTLDPGQRPDRVKASYRTQNYADEGRPWLEAIAGSALVFLSREISDPIGRLAHPEPDDAPKPMPPLDLPPEVIAEALDQRIRQFYADWADQPLPVLHGRTPRDAIKTQEGLEQVKFLLHTYEHGEVQQAKDQGRPVVSYEFLWRELGITP